MKDHIESMLRNNWQLRMAYWIILYNSYLLIDNNDFCTFLLFWADAGDTLPQCFVATPHNGLSNGTVSMLLKSILETQVMQANRCFCEETYLFWYWDIFHQSESYIYHAVPFGAAWPIPRGPLLCNCAFAILHHYQIIDFAINKKKNMTKMGNLCQFTLNFTRSPNRNKQYINFDMYHPKERIVADLSRNSDKMKTAFRMQAVAACHDDPTFNLQCYLSYHILTTQTNGHFHEKRSDCQSIFK